MVSPLETSFSCRLLLIKIFSCHYNPCLNYRYCDLASLVVLQTREVSTEHFVSPQMWKYLDCGVGSAQVLLNIYL